MTTETLENSAIMDRPTLEGIVPYLMVDGANKAADFYIEAFGAEDLFRVPVDENGRTMHIMLRVNGHSLMLCDIYPEHCSAKGPAGFNLHMVVDDLDAVWDRAVAAGCTVVLPLTDMPWGDRYGQLKDPFGATWALAHPIEG